MWLVPGTRTGRGGSPAHGAGTWEQLSTDLRCASPEPQRRQCQGSPWARLESRHKDPRQLGVCRPRGSGLRSGRPRQTSRRMRFIPRHRVNPPRPAPDLPSVDSQDQRLLGAASPWGCVGSRGRAVAPCPALPLVLGPGHGGLCDRRGAVTGARAQAVPLMQPPSSWPYAGDTHPQVRKPRLRGTKGTARSHTGSGGGARLCRPRKPTSQKHWHRGTLLRDPKTGTERGPGGPVPSRWQFAQPVSTMVRVEYYSATKKDRSAGAG